MNELNLAPTADSKPRISVITPAYNSKEFIGETLDSVAALAAPHEHIVIDGGSDDGTVDLLTRRTDPALEWVSEPDRGQVHAVNKGLARARGELIGWLNADDAYVAENLDLALRRFDDPAVDAVFGYMDVVDGSGAPVKRYRPARFSWTRYLYSGENVPTPTIVFRRSLLSSTEPLDESYPYSADYDFYLRLLRGRRIELVPQALVRFRYHESSKTATGASSQRQEGLQIRLTFARNGLERALMRMIDRANGIRRQGARFWPDLPENS